MSKEYLEAFRGFKYGMITDNAVCITKSYFDDKFPIIEQALQRLEAIDNAEPSEALKCLDKIAKQIELDEDTDYWEIRNAHKTVENALIKAQKEHKALEIIKEKYPNVVEVKLCKDYEHYKLRMSSKHDTEIVKIDWNDKSLLDYLLLLTEEEFNLLKEVLE